ncbi:glycoside hydrolase family 9 protein [Actinospica acidithermotolerans]|uniref:glycoside hydrolase family 9 protein n=1 Tax=Actinospica acidithermotolerans TaxID=2828514 RepID=UPI002013BCBB|nr:glycoside hydrolase family 9 protein [Actinospica acidithermotolerans]
MRKPHHLRALVAASTGLGVAGALVLLPSASAFAANAAQLRVDQYGYSTSDTKIAYLMATSAVSGESYSVIDSSGATVASGTVTSTSRGSWNSAYPDVYPIDFSSVTAAGTYHLTVAGSQSATSDTFQIEAASSLYAPLVSDGVNFFENQRDGANLVGTSSIARKASHTNDAIATVYKDPSFISGSDGGTGDQISGSLSKVSGASAVDVEGGWFDAGDYLKFTFTTAYADDLLYAADLALGSSAPASLTTEAQFGTTYLNKMWNPSTKTLYLQVGIGEGDETNYYGDHDLWRQPQADDSDTASTDYYAAEHRPVFEAASPGSKISPDVVGRVAAAFAFAAQQDEAAGDTADAQTELADATSLYAMADTSAAENSSLTSALPEAYYPESIWHDAMELAATEIVRAEQDLGNAESSYSSYLTQAATWASDYISADSGNDTLNLYDVSALAHADLVTAIKDAGSPSGLAVTSSSLIANLKAQLSAAVTKAGSDIFRAGGDYTNFDVDSHTFGFISIEALYQKASGDTEYAAFASEQRDWLLGDNAWGTSFVAGVGTTYPKCMGGQIENLNSAVDVGAVVNGPNGTSNFSGGLGSLMTGMAKCENDSFTTFTGKGGEYVDDVRSWQSSEPALDMTGSLVLAGALQDEVGGGSSSGGGGTGGGSTCTAGQLLGDPGFENGSTITPWTETSTLGFTPVTNASGETAHGGSWMAWFDGNGTKDTDTLSQSVALPSSCTSATLSYWLHVDTTESTSTAKPDTFTVQLLDSSGNVLTTLATFSNLNAASGYTQYSYNVSSYLGKTVTLKFSGTETDTDGGTTSFVDDDNALNVS